MKESASHPSEPQVPTLEQLRSKDSGAWEDLFRIAHPKLVRYGNARFPGKGEDIAQTAWSNFLPKLAELPDDSNILGYLMRCAVNNTNNIARVDSRMLYSSEVVEKMTAVIPAPRIPVEDEVISKLMRDELLEGIDNPDQKKVVFLASEGYTNSDTAHVTGINRMTVGTRLMRGLSKIKVDKETDIMP